MLGRVEPHPVVIIFTPYGLNGFGIATNSPDRVVAPTGTHARDHDTRACGEVLTKGVWGIGVGHIDTLWPAGLQVMSLP